MKLELQRYGFYPAGGGRIVVEITPTDALKPIELDGRGEITTKSFARNAECSFLGLGIKKDWPVVKTAVTSPRTREMQVRVLPRESVPAWSKRKDT